jgi:diaminohydroxyphosphoribosylaminopyrimidine deaminase/5-amino-6-(5-phosphoribosylamino)uracil reductase
MTRPEEFMAHALALAGAARGLTDSEPLEGAVLIAGSSLVGMGARLSAGAPHGVAIALGQAGRQARGGTLYTTIEPCARCVALMIEAGVSAVEVALRNPVPTADGRSGLALLERGGVVAGVGLLEAEALALNEVFIKYATTGRPFVTVTSSVSWDGKMATASGDSRWVSSSEALEDVHRLRHQHQAILVGVNTVLADDPKLTTRIPHGRHPLRVVLDSRLRTPPTARLLDAATAPAWIFTSPVADPARRRALEKAGATVFVTGQGNRTDIQDTLAILGQHGIASLLVEGGGEVNGAFFDSRLVDKIVLYLAPKLVGGRDAPTFVEGRGVGLMQDAIALQVQEVTSVGSDLKLVGYPRYSS